MELAVFILEVIGTVAFAVSGALVASEKKMDLLGVIILGVTASVGGGIIRDIILGNTPPQAFVSPIYLIIAICVSLVIFIPSVRKLFLKKEGFFDKMLLVMDSLGLSIFTVVGISVAGNGSSDLFLRAFVGVLTGVGGGVLRDMMAEKTPYIFQKHFYCTASIIGSVIAVVLWNYLGSTISMMIGAVMIFILRILAAKFRWKLPKA